VIKIVVVIVVLRVLVAHNAICINK